MRSNVFKNILELYSILIKIYIRILSLFLLFRKLLSIVVNSWKNCQINYKFLLFKTVKLLIKKHITDQLIQK